MAEKRKSKWISGAVEHPGALRHAAKAAGESTTQYAEGHKGDAGKTGRRARLALTLMSLGHKERRKRIYDNPTSRPRD